MYITQFKFHAFIHQIFLQLANPHINVTSTIPPNPSIAATYHTIPHATIHSSTVSNPTYINSSASISEHNYPFERFDHYYTPEEYLQHIEARVTFSIGLQTTTDHEYKVWQATRMFLYNVL